MKTFTTSDGLRLAYAIDDFTDPWAKAPTLLLLHAAMGSARRYFGWVPHLCREYRVVRLDLRGHGASQVPQPDRELTLDRLVRDVAELLDQLGCGAAHVVGNSAGGYLGQQLAMTRPERVTSLSLFGSTPGLKNSQAASWIPQIQAKGMRGFLAETIRDRLPADADPGLVGWFLDEAAKNDPGFIGKFVLLMASYDWSGEVQRILCPTLVVIPGAETVGSLENYQPFRRLKDAEFKTYEGMPHNICDAAPDRCATDVRDFLARRFAVRRASMSVCFFVLGSVAFSVAAYAQSQNADEPAQNSSAAETKIDKSQFNLFNPTPDENLRPFSTDRPGKTHSSLTVDAGHFQLEGDFWNYTYDHWSNDGSKTRAYTLINPNLKLGVTNWAELDVFLPLYNSLEVKSGTGAATLRAQGFGDFLVGGKVNFFGNDGGDQSLGAIGFVKVPTAARGLGNDHLEYTLNFPFTTALPNKFSLTAEPAVGLLRNSNNTGYQGDYQMLVNLNRPIIGEVVTAALELALDFPGDHRIGQRHTIDPSLQWLVTPNLQLDVGVYIGLTKAAPDFNPYVGISFRF